MNKIKLPCCFIPNNVVVVDDNQSYLQSLKSELSSVYGVITYNNPKAALEFFQKQFHSSPFTDKCIIAEEEAESDHSVTEVDLRVIREEVYNQKRFSEIAVIVVDYAMPGISGLELCQQLKHLKLKKLMLTGEAHNDLAVDAFNEGSIDKFIMKDRPNILDDLIDSIANLQRQYFLELSEWVINGFRMSSDKLLSCLYDPTFINYFKTICEKNNIIEYYLTDSDGGFLLLDENAKPSWLAVKDSQAMQKFYDIAHSAGAPEAILSALSEHKKVPYFFSDEDLDTPPTEWGPYLHPAKTLTGELETYCIAHITDPDAYELDRSKILPYQRYLDEHR